MSTAIYRTGEEAQVGDVVRLADPEFDDGQDRLVEAVGEGTVSLRLDGVVRTPAARAYRLVRRDRSVRESIERLRSVLEARELRERLAYPYRRAA